MLTPIERKRRLPQAVSLEDFAGVLAKLGREVERLFTSQTLEDVVDHSFNCAVTANHLLDWGWAKHLHRARTAGDLPREPSTKKEMRTLVVSRLPDWELIETIANASKHANRSREGRDVSAFPFGMRLGAIVPPDWDGDEAVVDWSQAKWQWSAPLIVDGTRQVQAYMLFKSTLEFWTQFAMELGFFDPPQGTEGEGE